MVRCPLLSRMGSSKNPVVGWPWTVQGWLPARPGFSSDRSHAPAGNATPDVAPASRFLQHRAWADSDSPRLAAIPPPTRSPFLRYRTDAGASRLRLHAGAWERSWSEISAMTGHARDPSPCMRQGLRQVRNAGQEDSIGRIVGIAGENVFRPIPAIQAILHQLFISPILSVSPVFSSVR